MTTITSQILVDSHQKATVKYVGNTNSNVTYSTLLDAGALKYALNANGYIMGTATDRRNAYSVSIKRVYGQAYFKNGGHATLSWAGANTDIITIVTGSFDYNFEAAQGIAGEIGFDDAANCTGNINITTTNVGLGDVLTLFLTVKKNASDYDQGQREDPAAFNWTAS